MKQFRTPNYLNLGRVYMAQGQIRKALSGYYYVYYEGELIQCRGRGVFRNRGESPLVGDIVDLPTPDWPANTVT